ncbi:hypothetical protein RIF29_42302 [Crotalaria pallida]|uniref:Uncharacterized protein n=1 Tax=Crotalaria pallida TaxID=3830 RepID=A0AAN9E738_CROPI
MCNTYGVINHTSHPFCMVNGDKAWPKSFLINNDVTVLRERGSLSPATPCISLVHTSPIKYHFCHQHHNMLLDRHEQVA